MTHERLDLTSSYLKLKWAKKHIDILRASIDEIGAKGEFLPIAGKYEAEQRAFIFRIERVINIPDEWSLIVGDVAHNLRGALDHLVWQMAVRHNDGHEPTDYNVVSAIRFPVVMKECDWKSDRLLKYIEPGDAVNLEKLQPFRLQTPRGEMNPLVALCSYSGLSNVDKHRKIELACVVPQQGHIKIPTLGEFQDCVPTILEDGGVAAYYLIPAKPPQPGDEVLRIPVATTGPNPQAEFNARFTTFIAVRETWKLPDCLDTMAEWVKAILRFF